MHAIPNSCARSVSPIMPAARLLALMAALLACAACGGGPAPSTTAAVAPPIPAPATPGAPPPGLMRPPTPIQLPEETRLGNVRKLTSGGENAEAYWSFDGSRLIFQARTGDRSCDAMYVMNADGSGKTEIASVGAHTCGYFLKGDQRVIFASTLSGGPDCPAPPDRSKGYVWPLHDMFEIYSTKPDGSDLVRLTDSPGYDAEGTVGPDGRIIFTSVRDGDLELYTMAADGSDVKRLTNAPGYDGGAFFSPDGTTIIYRTHHVTEPAELAEYQMLLMQGLVRPSRLEIWAMNADGSNQHEVTHLGSAAFAPSFLPGGERIIFASNHEDPKGRNFDLYLIRLDGSGLERVTFNDTFDGFPHFSPDGKHLAFCSNRGNSSPGETNVFVAEWIE